MKKLIFIFLTFVVFASAMEQPQQAQNPLVFLRVSNPTNTNYRMRLENKPFSIKKNSKVIFENAIPSRADIFFQREGEWAQLQFKVISEKNFADFSLFSLKAGNVMGQLANKQFTSNIADTYAVNLTLAGDELEKSSFEVTQIKNALFAKLLRAHGSNINGKNDEGNTPLLSLFFANPQFETKGISETASFLIKAGANPNIQNKHGATPLHVALWKKNEHIVELLVNAGADITIKDQRNMTPLHLAAFDGLANSMRLLLANGAELNVKNIQGNTPLHLAVAGGAAVAKLLIDAGAKLTIKNNRGETPIRLAQRLIEEGDKSKQPIFDFLRKAQDESQRRYVKEWQSKLRMQP